MTIVRNLALMAALAAFARPASAEPVDGSWNTKYGMLFSLQNVFTQGGILDDYQGGVGLQYNLGADRSVRMSVSLAHVSNPTREEDTTNLVTGTTDTNLYVPGGYLSEYEVGVGASYMMRLGTAALAPYLGVGGRVNFYQGTRDYEDDLTSTTTITAEDDLYRDISLVALGHLGLEWRVHRSVSFFAEYGLGVSVVSFITDNEEYSTTDKATGAVTFGTRTESSGTRFFNFGTGLIQGGQLGLVAFF